MSNITKKFVLPANFSYNDPLPFECDTSTNAITSLIMYALQASYLILGAVLNVLIIRTIFRTKQSVYRGNSFYLLYTADAIVCIYINISELLIGRLFTFITPLCPIVSPYFFTPSILFKTYYTAVHYSVGFKTVSQIFLSLNRMTCVIMPMQHISLWRKILYPVLIATFVLPVGGIWNILISRVYINPNGGGFSVNYKETITWANLSMLHLIYCVICFIFVIIFFFVTIFGLVMLERRVKGTERSLTLATMVMAIQMLIFAATQIYFVFFAAALPSIRPLLLLSAVTIYDSMNVASPIALILMSRQLRKDIFNLSDDTSRVAPSKSVSTVSQHSQPFRNISTVVSPTVPL